MISLRVARLVTPHRLTALALRNRSFRSTNKETAESERDPSEPIKYSTSEAAKWMAAEGYGSMPSKRPKYERFVIMTSIFIFMVYFCIFREENDIDQAMGQTLKERLAASEEKYNARKTT